MGVWGWHWSTRFAITWDTISCDVRLSDLNQQTVLRIFILPYVILKLYVCDGFACRKISYYGFKCIWPWCHYVCFLTSLPFWCVSTKNYIGSYQSNILKWIFFIILANQIYHLVSAQGIKAWNRACLFSWDQCFLLLLYNIIFGSSFSHTTENYLRKIIPVQLNIANITNYKVNTSFKQINNLTIKMLS